MTAAALTLILLPLTSWMIAGGMLFAAFLLGRRRAVSSG